MNFFFSKALLASNTNFNEYLNKYKVEIKTGEDFYTHVSQERRRIQSKFANDIGYQLKKVCFELSEGYTDKVIENCLHNIITEENPKFDIILLTNDTFNLINNMSGILGFIIVEAGECNTDSNRHIPVLNLLCKSPYVNSNLIPIARILLYTYVYTMYKNNYSHALLELGNHYQNVRGLCLYYKFGFREDISLKSQECFPDGLHNTYKITLPMYLDLEDNLINDNTLFNTLQNENLRLNNNPYNEPICMPELRVKQAQYIKKRVENLNIIIDMYKSEDREYIMKALRRNNILVEAELTIPQAIQLLNMKSLQGESIRIPRNTRGSAPKTKKKKRNYSKSKSKSNSKKKAKIKTKKHSKK